MILDFQNINKSFSGVSAISDVSLSLKKNSILGLVGENGAGKSTLMNILGGVITPDSGRIFLNGENYSPQNPMDALNSGISFIHQELNLFPNLSIADNIFINGFPKYRKIPFINKASLNKKTREIIKLVNLKSSPGTLVGELTPGEKQLVEISKALCGGAEIVIFDEPTTSLTNRETSKLFKIISQLKSQNKTLIYISHNLEDVMKLSDYIAVLKDGQIVSTGLTKDYSINSMISSMVGREIKQLYPVRSSKFGSDVALSLNNVSQSGIVKDINLSLRRKEILGLFGLMGSGRSELARIIFGLEDFESGEININGVARNEATPEDSIKNKLAFVTENRREEGLLMNASIAENIALVSLRNYTSNKIFKTLDKNSFSKVLKEIVESLKIKSASLDNQHVQNLSGGNQQKVVIAKWLLSNPSILILDEPTRGIDVGAKLELYNIICDLTEKDVSILLISSELEELVGLCDRIMVMKNGEIEAEFEREMFNEEKILQAAFGEQDEISLN